MGAFHGAQLNLYWAEFQIPVWRMQSRGWKLWDALTDTFAESGLLDDYDLIFLDTPPALGYLTINGLAAADIPLVPTGPLSSNSIPRGGFSTWSIPPSP